MDFHQSYGLVFVIIDNKKNHENIRDRWNFNISAVASKLSRANQNFIRHGEPNPLLAIR